MASSDDTTVRIERDGAVGRVVLNRPAHLNTITPVILSELSAAIDDLEADPDVRCLVLSGAGDRAFSAGADLSGFADESLSSIDAVELARTAQRTFAKFETCDMPVVAAVDGYCLGGGMELAAAADLRIASTDAVFGQPEHRLGLLPGWGGTQRLSRLIGESRATEIIFTGDRYSAAEMADYGFVTRAVDPDEFDVAAQSVADTLAAGPPIAQRYTKRAIVAGRESTEAGLELEAQSFGHLFSTHDFEAGLAAFTDDTEPTFTGE